MSNYVTLVYKETNETFNLQTHDLHAYYCSLSSNYLINMPKEVKVILLTSTQVSFGFYNPFYFSLSILLISYQSNT